MINKVLFAGERASLKDSGGINIARYQLAKGFCKNKKVLEIGCGSGYGTKYLADNGAKKIRAYDADKKAIKFAQHKFQRENIEFIAGNIESAKANAKFDCVISFEVIEHLKEPNLLLRFAKASLTAKGQLFISTPNRLASSYDGNRPSNPYHVREYTPKEFKDLLRNFFRSVEVFGIILKNQHSEKEVQSSWRWKLASKIVKKRKLRFLINYLPEKPKRIFTGESNLQFNPEDFIFTKKNLDETAYLMAICKI